MGVIRILMLGDAVGREGTGYLSSSRRLASMRKSLGADFVVVNGENSAEGNGMTPASADALLDAGADVITGGNHTWRRREIATALDDREELLRPANYPAAAAGHGYGIFDVAGRRILVMNLIGCVSMEPVDSPFLTADKILEREKGKYDMCVVDIHAEATSEKIALARYLDGRVSAVAGTHTHVQTADAQVLPGGTGYITDLGMCGSQNGVLGVKTECILKKFLVKTPVFFEAATGQCAAHGCLFTIDTESGKCLSAEGISF